MFPNARDTKGEIQHTLNSKAVIKSAISKVLTIRTIVDNVRRSFFITDPLDSEEQHRPNRSETAHVRVQRLDEAGRSSEDIQEVEVRSFAIHAQSG